ncbi:MAG TPA: hydantoinase/oxoprolinase N-terminal domain-containing protein, partial [Thermomicrobiales bacterium]|nr:hydantoinase/oxoprolinase N-terminal domain-containing protein [Thermomicrobiales bacterium]
MTLRIGVDVGGTNTDAVLMDGTTVIAKIKTPTTEDVTGGITTALRHVLAASGAGPDQIAAAMIGTTHFTNAVVERRRLEPTAAVRLGLPATAALPPFVDWPDDLADTLGRHAYLCHGGHEFDGREISPLDDGELQQVAADLRAKGITAI